MWLFCRKTRVYNNDFRTFNALADIVLQSDNSDEPFVVGYRQDLFGFRTEPKSGCSVRKSNNRPSLLKNNKKTNVFLVVYLGTVNCYRGVTPWWTNKGYVLWLYARPSPSHTITSVPSMATRLRVRRKLTKIDTETDFYRNNLQYCLIFNSYIKNDKSKTS